MYREQHKERKAQVIGVIEKARTCCETLGYQDKVEVFDELKRATQEDEFSIVVVGEFSAGKSTFLNALMGKRYLPSYTSETTATVNFLVGNKGSAEEKAIIHYKEDGKEPLTVPANMENILKYTAVNNEIDVVKNIEKVELQLNSSFLNDGVMLVDSPGLNGVEQGHREITEAQIEKSHACIFLFSAEQPGRKSDFEFLNEIKSKVNRIFLVLNKIDVIRQSEQTIEEVMNKLRENYHKYFPNEELPEIWPIAAYPALVARDGGLLDYNGKTEHTDEERAAYLGISRIEQFEERLWRFLTEGEKTKDALLEPVKRVKQLIEPLITKEKELINGLNKQHDSQEVQEQLDALNREIEELENNLREEDSETEELLDLKIRNMKESIEANIQQMVNRYNKQLELAEEIDDFEEIRQNLNQSANSEIKKIMTKVHQEFVENIQEVVRKRYKNYYRDLQSSINNMSFNNDVAIDQIQEIEFSFGFEDYDQKMEKLQEEMSALDKKIEQTRENRFEAMQYEMHKDDLKSEIKELENRKLQMIATLGPRPLKKSYETMETRVVKRSAIGQFFLGDKCKSFAVTHTNDDEIAAYAKEKEAIEARFAKEEADLKEKLKGFNKTSTNVAFYQEQQKQVERMQQEKKNEIENLRREHQEKFKAGREKAVRKLRNQITTTINEMETEIMNRLYNEMRLRRDDVLAIVNDIVEKNVREKCNQKIEEKERLQSILESSIQERNAQVLASEEKIKALTEVSTEVENVVIDLEMIEVDHIEYSV